MLGCNIDFAGICEMIGSLAKMFAVNFLTYQCKIFGALIKNCVKEPYRTKITIGGSLVARITRLVDQLRTKSAFLILVVRETLMLAPIAPN